jgi:hypothetical protein
LKYKQPEHIFEALEQLLVKDTSKRAVRLPHYSRNEQNLVLRLKEDDKSSKIAWVDLDGFYPHVLAIKMDAFDGHVYPFLDKTYPDIHKACDALIFGCVKDKGYILACELKSDSPKDVSEKFKNADVLVHYLNALLQHYTPFNLNGFKRVRILFSTQGKSTVNARYRYPELDGLGADTVYIHDRWCSKETSRHVAKYLHDDYHLAHSLIQHKYR